MPRKHENKVVGYLKPKNNALFIGFVTLNQMGKSEAINVIVKDYFQRVSESDKYRYLNENKKIK